MKTFNRIIRIALYVAVACSIILSYFIWTNSTNRNTQTVVNNSNVVVTAKDAQDVFVPTQLVWHKEEEKLWSNRESLIVAIQKELTKKDYSSIQKQNKVDESTFRQMFQKEKRVELIFPQAMSLNEYKNIYDFDFQDKIGNETFNRIMVDLTEARLYFLDTEKQTIYWVDSVGTFDEFTEMLTDKDISYMPVTVGHDVLPYVYYMEETQLKQYSYILATQPYTTYIQALFQNTNNIISDEGGGGAINYTSRDNEVLTVREDEGSIVFRGQIPEKALESINGNNLAKSFYFVGRLANYYGKMRYFDQKGDHYYYRNYIEGFPVFNPNQSGSTIDVWMNGDEAQINTINQTIQIPIPADEVSKLESTQSVIDRMIDMGIHAENIQDLQIGYTWVNLTETKQIVDLRPEWFFKLNNNWYAVTEQNLGSAVIDQGGE